MRYAHLTITAPLEFIGPTLADDSANPYWPLVTTLNDAIDSQRKGNAQRYSDGQNYHWEGELDLTFFDIDALQLVVANGGEVKNFPAFFEIASLDAVLPASLQYSYEGGDDPEAPETINVDTWGKWNRLGHSVHVGDSRNFLSTAANNGQSQPGSVLVQVIAEGTIVVAVNNVPVDPEPAE